MGASAESKDSFLYGQPLFRVGGLRNQILRSETLNPEPEVLHGLVAFVPRGKVRNIKALQGTEQAERKKRSLNDVDDHSIGRWRFRV